MVGPDGEEFPAVRLVFGQIVVDNDWLGRVIEIVFDLLNLRNLRELGDVECAVVESEAVGPIESRVERLDLAPAGLVIDGFACSSPPQQKRRALIQRLPWTWTSAPESWIR